jgi:hypothetical protein
MLASDSFWWGCHCECCDCDVVKTKSTPSLLIKDLWEFDNKKNSVHCVSCWCTSWETGNPLTNIEQYKDAIDWGSLSSHFWWKALLRNTVWQWGSEKCMMRLQRLRHRYDKYENRWNQLFLSQPSSKVRGCRQGTTDWRLKVYLGSKGEQLKKNYGS